MARFSVRFLSGKLMRHTEVRLVIPSLDLHGAISAPGGYYSGRAEKFPLVIMLSGFGDDVEAWSRRAEIPELCDKYRVAAAIVGGENKWYLNLSPVDNWPAFLSEELPDFLCGNFSAIDGGRRILCGVSMGGYGALHNGLKFPEKYKAVAAFSPALRPDDYIDEVQHGTLKDKFLCARDKLPYMYISYGENDFVYDDAVRFDRWLSRNAGGVRVRFVPGFGHTWELWRLEIRNFFDKLKQKNII